MTHKLMLLFTSILLFSCGTEKQTEKNTEAETEITESVQQDYKNENPSIQVVNNLYCGSFIATVFNPQKEISSVNRISIVIDDMNNGEIRGHSVVAGNSRPFEGKYVTENGKHVVTVQEPGDDKYDGKFSFTINPDSGFVTGTWVANDAKLPVTERKFTLNKTVFTYDANLTLPQSIAGAELYSNAQKEGYDIELISEDAIKYNASADELKKEQVENMYKGDLEILRNAIYARHGYSFKGKRMRFVFDTYVDWYIPLYTDIRNELTELEKKNIDLLKRYEEHAQNYYDVFGR